MASGSASTSASSSSCGSAGLLGVFLGAVGLIEQFNVVRVERVSGAQVEGGFGGVAERLVNVTDLAKNLSVVGEFGGQCIECGQCSCVVSGSL